MVSIPNWSSFRNFVGTSADVQLLQKRKKYFNNISVRTALKRGYLVHLTSTYLEQCVEDDKCLCLSDSTKKERDLNDIIVLRLAQCHLRTIDSLSLCANLRICLLGENFISNIDALRHCFQLFELDLHSNEISQLPDATFWQTFRCLKIVLLHDNPLADFESVQNLASCVSLTALTLFNTPLSLTQHYRHQIVNTIFSLKALDGFVIADEEIIEDAIFGGRFAALSDSFAIDLRQNYDVSLQETIFAALDLIQQINRIQAHSSPILIIQRYFRGHYTRRYLRRFGHLWIDKRKAPFYPSRKHMQHAATVTVPLSSHSVTPVPTQRSYDMGPEQLDIIAAHLDKVLATDTAKTSQNKQAPAQPDTQADTTDQAKKAWRLSYSASVQISGQMPLANQSHMTGEEYAVVGKREEIRTLDATQELILSNMEAHRAVQAMKHVSHASLAAALPVALPRDKHEGSAERFMTAALLRLSTLRAVDKAYDNRDKAEAAVKRSEQVSEWREASGEGLQRTRLFMDMRSKDMARRGKEEMGERMVHMRSSADKERQEVEEGRQRRERHRRHVEQAKASAAFVREFSVRNTSISNALRRHDIHSKRQEQQRTRTLTTGAQRDVTTQTRNEIRLYMQHRLAKKHTDVAAERAQLDSLLRRTAAQRLLDARLRVAELRAVRAIEHLSPRDQLVSSRTDHLSHDPTALTT